MNLDQTLSWLAAGALVVGLGIPAYGLWRAWSRADISIYVFQSNKQNEPLVGADILIRSAAHQILAEGKSTRRGLIYFNHPQFGMCEYEEDAVAEASWSQCEGEVLRWHATWAAKIASMEVRFEGCGIKNIPLTLDVFRTDWWLWWVPHPEIGRDPLTFFSGYVYVDSEACRARTL